MDMSNIPEAFKEQARACRTPEDFLELAKKAGIELTDEQLDGVFGGASLFGLAGDKDPDRPGVEARR